MNIVIIALFLLVRLIGVGTDISNTDSIRWHRRSEEFLAGVKNGDLTKTYQHYQPGVSVMWITAPIRELMFRFQMWGGVDEPKTLNNADFFPTIHGLSKASIVIVLSILLFIQLVNLEKLYGLKIACIFGFLVCLEPYLVGIDRWFHLTSLETYFAFTALLLLLTWRKTRKYSLLTLSAILYALSVLSKLTSLSIAPIFVFIILFEANGLKNLVRYIFVGLLVILILFPAVWADFPVTVIKLLEAISNAVGNTVRNEIIIPTIRTFYYEIILLFKLSPITLVLFITSLFKNKISLKKSESKIIYYTLFLYFIVLTISQQKIDRYAVVMFPYIILLSSIILASFPKNIIKKILLMVCGYFIFVSFIYFPVYSAYYSPIFGGTKRALDMGVYDNSGEYFAQAALYLNEKGRNIVTSVPNGYSSFSCYYKGEISRYVTSRSDYLVYSIDASRIRPDNYGCGTLDKVFGSKEYPVVYISKCK